MPPPTVAAVLPEKVLLQRGQNDVDYASPLSGSRHLLKMLDAGDAPPPWP
jgi:hypothetical protein